MIFVLSLLIAPGLLSATLVPGMRIARHRDAQGINRAVRAAEQGSQIRSAKGEIDRLLRPPDAPNSPAVWFHDPDAARSGTINPADAVDLQPVRDARLAALVK